MAGTLGKVELLPPIDLYEGQAHLQVSQRAREVVAQLGVAYPQPPKSGFQGDLPEDITSLDDEQLGDLLNNLSQLLSYLDFKLADAENQRNEAEAILKYVQARIRMAMKAEGKKTTVGDKNDATNTDPRVVTAWGTSLCANHIYELTKALRNRAQSGWETVSRRITQRGQEVDRMRRESNIAGVPNAARVFRRP